MLKTRKECREGGVVFYLQEAKRQEDGGAPLTVCLTDGQAEALMALELLDRGQNPGGAIAAAVVPDLLPDEQEQALADFVFALQSYSGVCPTRISLTGSVACADLVWRLASHFPAWFSAVCAVGGKGNPYEVRALTSTPLRAYIFPGEERADGGLPAAGERLVAALRIAGSDSASCVRIDPSRAGEHAWERIFEDGSVLAWLQEQDKKRQFTVSFVKPGVWCIEDYFTSCCYLVEGRDRAVLVDTGMGEGDLLGLVRSLTPLPVDLAVTHPHGDHMRGADRFPRVYLHEKDIESLAANPERFPAAWTPGSTVRPELVPIREGSLIDLGGVVLETQELGGHTENSVVFADAAHRLLFTGDAVGSGYIALMICRQDELTECISHYADGLRAYADHHLDAVRDYGWLGGHKIQENGCDARRQQDFLAGRSAYFNPIRPQILLDMLTLCEQILDGTVTLADLLSTEEHYCSFGTAGMFFRFID